MDQALEYLVKADRHLETISVKGVDVYELINARSAIKAAYDELKREAQKDVSEREG